MDFYITLGHIPTWFYFHNFPRKNYVLYFSFFWGEEKRDQSTVHFIGLFLIRKFTLIWIFYWSQLAHIDVIFTLILYNFLLTKLLPFYSIDAAILLYCLKVTPRKFCFFFLFFSFFFFLNKWNKVKKNNYFLMSSLKIRLNSLYGKKLKIVNVQ